MFYQDRKYLEKDKASVCDASGLLLGLEDRSFILYLRFFHHLMPHVYRYSVCPAAKASNQLNLHSDMHKKFCGVNDREKIPDIFHNDSCAVNEEPLAKRPRCEYFDEEISMRLGEVCDVASQPRL